jgi:hypothetical protein
MLKKASDHYTGRQTFYGPIWQHVGGSVIKCLSMTVFDSDDFLKHLYVKERVSSHGLCEEDIVKYIKDDNRKPLVVCGLAGIGKTTFLYHSLCAVIPKEIAIDLFWVNVDNVRGATSKPDELVRIVESKIAEHLQEFIGDEGRIGDWWKFLLKKWKHPKEITSLLAYQISDSEELSKEILVQLIEIVRDIDLLTLNRLRIRFLREVLRRYPIIVIDNADLLPAEFYPQLIKLAIDLARGSSLPADITPRRHLMDAAKIVIALRPESLPHASTRHPNTFIRGTLHPPRLGLVLRQRIAKVLRELETNPIPASYVRDFRGIGTSISEESSRITKEQGEALLLKTVDALTANTRTNEELVQLLQSLANNSVRVSLVALAGYIASGHHEWKNIVAIVMKQTDYPYHISYRKALKVLLLGSRAIYSTRESWPFNLFGDGKRDEVSVLGSLRILRLCEKETAESQSKGISKELTADYMKRLFDYPQDRSIELLQRLYFSGLLNDEDEAAIFKLTIAGERYLRVMSKEFEYLQHVVIDSCVDADHLTPCSQIDEPLTLRYLRVLRFAEWVRSLEVKEYMIVLKNSEEPFYCRLYESDTISKSLTNVLVNTFNALPDLKSAKDADDMNLLKKTEELLQSCFYDSIRQDAVRMLDATKV